MTMATGKPRTPLRSIRAKNYRSFVDVDVEFGPFSVLAGPNGSGKSNLLSVLQLVRDTARTDIPTAVDRHGGYEQLRRATGDAGPIELADASFGAVRMLALLTALHDPDPPALTVIEEVDHGLHPYALDVLADRMREASGRTQIIAVSHSPTLVNRLEPEELILCDRDPGTGESVIPVLTADRLADSQETSGRGLGELWYSGVLDGVPSVG